MLATGSCCLAIVACREVVRPALESPREVTRAADVASGSAPKELGIGGAFFMAAAGDAVTPVDLQGTGITMPVGTEVEVEIEIGGSITRAHTPGLVQFCALPHMRPRCLGAWAEILRTSPFAPSDGDGPRARVSWDGGDPVSPDSGTSRVLSGPAGGELWAGRDGLQCWYIDHVTGIQGACFAFGGGYLVTVRPRPTATLGGGGGSAASEATLTLSVLGSTVGPAGGSADLTLRVATKPDSAAEPPLAFTQWYFIADSIRTATGTPVPSPFDLRASDAAGEPHSQPVRLDADRVRLPDGRIVGSGIHVTRGSTAPGSAAGIRASRSAVARAGAHAAGSFASAGAHGTITEYPVCDGKQDCHVQFSASSGTIVVSAKLGGVPVSASARVGVAGGGETGTLSIVRVAGPNPGGSFTTLENQIALEATASPGYSGSVEWEFVDDPGDHVDSPHVVSGRGAKTVASVSPAIAARSRWPATHPGRLDQKAFRYIVRAYAMYGGTRVYSVPTVLTQDVADVIRQEFIEYDTPLALIPAPAAFTRAIPAYFGVYQHSPTSETGLGDYCVTGGARCTTLVSERLSPFLTWLQGVWKHQPLVATSIFRNPVHHHGHMAATNNSPHKYGTAVDYDVVGENKSQQQRLHWTALRNTGLRFPPGGVCAETWYLGRFWAGDHVHFDLRYPAQVPCPATWKVHEDILTQQSMAPASQVTHDTLVVMLESADAGSRFTAAGALAQLPHHELPPGYAAAARRQLEVEISRRIAGAAAEHEEYGAYLLELARLVHRSGDPAAAASLARLGIDVSLGIRRFVARYAALSIPALEQSWHADESLHADVIGTYAEMLRFQADSGWTLEPDAVVTVDRAFMRAAAGGVIGQWGAAFHVGQLGLAEFAPLLSFLASQPPTPDDPAGLVAAAASASRIQLEPALRSAGAVELLPGAMRLHSSVCSGSSGQRLGQCVALGSMLSNAARALAQGAKPAARAALQAYAELLDRAGQRGIFTSLEQHLLEANVTIIMEKLE